MDASALENAEFWLSVLYWAKLAAAFFVAAGVAVEFAGDWAARPFEKVVEAHRRLELATIQNKAAEATRKAAELGLSFNDLDDFVKDQQAKAAQIMADAQQEIAQLKGPRNLSATAQAKLTTALLPLGPKKFNLGVLIGGLEPGSDLLKQMYEALIAAHWEIVPGKNKPTARGQPAPNNGIGGIIGIVGVKVLYSAERASEFSAAAAAICNALNDAGIVAQPIELPADDESDPESLHISIGAKT